MSTTVRPVASGFTPQVAVKPAAAKFQGQAQGDSTHFAGSGAPKATSRFPFIGHIGAAIHSFFGSIFGFAAMPFHWAHRLAKGALHLVGL